MVKKFMNVFMYAAILMGLTPMLAGCEAYVNSQFAKTETNSAGGNLRKGKTKVAKQPNILYVFADQFREESLPWNDSCIIAPNLERMAREGATLNHAYTTNPICGPARASMITGMYPHMHGIVQNSIPLRTDLTSIAHVCRDNGYKTGYIGKWHLDGGDVRDDGGGKATFVPPGPRRQGFDYWAAFNGGHFYWDSNYFMGDDDTSINVKGYEPDYQTDLAIDFMKENMDNPFCLFMSWGPPHTPFYPPKNITDERWNNLNPDELKMRPNVAPQEMETARKEMAGYNVHITELDKNIGRILDALDEYGLSENTIFVFTSDHGDMLGSQGLYRKSHPYEESIHIPFLIRYPAKIAKSVKNNVMLSTIDFMPTFLSLCGLPIPKSVQGKDVSKAIIRNDAKLGPDSVYLEGAMGRKREWRTLRTQKYMFTVIIYNDRETAEVTHLYDMESDPYQMINLVDYPKYADLQKQLKDKMIKWAKETKDEHFLKMLEE